MNTAENSKDGALGASTAAEGAAENGAASPTKPAKRLRAQVLRLRLPPAVRLRCGHVAAVLNWLAAAEERALEAWWQRNASPQHHGNTAHKVSA
jgi:hypothetical protein